MLRDYIKSLDHKLLTIYFTAGFPDLDSMPEIINCLEGAGVDLVEVGVPFSDSLVDGPTIQKSNAQALSNGMNLKLLFEQLKSTVFKIPVVLMTSLNPVLQFGFERFLAQAKDSGVSGLIIPDLPPEIYEKKYMELVRESGLSISFLVTSHLEDRRIKYLDSLTTAFLYAVSSDATTGSEFVLDDKREMYISRLNTLNLENPFMLGFGIHDKKSFFAAAKESNGGIIGSAFIRFLEENSIDDISKFIQLIVKTESNFR